MHEEIRDVYVECMGKTVTGLFRTYQTQLAKVRGGLCEREPLFPLFASISTPPPCSSSPECSPCSPPLHQLSIKIATKSSLLASSSPSPSGPALFSSSKPSSGKTMDPFTVGDRGRVLDLVEEGPIVVHVAVSEKEFYP